MKQAYTSFHPPLQSALKQTGLSWDEFYKQLNVRFNTLDPNDMAMGYAFVIDKDIMDGNSTHIFMPDIKFCEWLVSCVPFLETIHARVVAKNIGEGKSGCLHFPTVSKLTSVGFWIPKLTCYLDGTNAPDYGMLDMSFSTGNNEGLAQICVKLCKEGQCSERGMWYAKLIVGLGMYIACFPETIHDGFPEDLKHPAYHQYQTTRIVGISGKICSGVERAGVSPHFRTGHFRVLLSEKFTHKRFQVIFIHETFVKGKAVTVEGVE